MGNAFLADCIVVVHVAYVGFVLVGLLAILVGGLLGWNWVRNPWFRSLHLLAIGIVTLEAIWGIECPLTTWEQALRRQAGQQAYAESFVAHWLWRLIFFEAPWWAFVAAYSVFAALVIGCWWWVPPRRR